jgi:hypothetical protein
VKLRRSDKPSTRELTALADGSLPIADWAQVRRAVDASPELRAGLEAQQRALTAIDATLGPAPAAVRARVAAMPARAHGRPARRARLSAAAATVAIVVAVAVAALSTGTAAPTVATAASLAQRPSQARAPEAQRGSPTLSVRAAGLTYPNWQDAFGYRATGVRRDQLGGRTATTVFYANRGGSAIAYTIVAGDALPVGTGARSTLLDGVWLRTLSRGDRAVVTWLRGGHTCVLSGGRAELSVLERLAAWEGSEPSAYERARGSEAI